MPVAKARLLLFGQPFQSVVPLPCRPEFVLIGAVEDAKTCQREGAQLRAKVDCVACVIGWRICGDVGPSII